VRPTNLIERRFEEEHRRTNILPRFWSEQSGLKLILAVLCRASARRTRMGGGGMKLGRSRPWRNESASHSLSLTSVLRPGTALMGCALTRMSARPSSSTLKTLLGALYAGLIIGLDSLATVLTGETKEPIALVLSTLAIAALFSAPAP
jgi:hypothetical protein